LIHNTPQMLRTIFALILISLAVVICPAQTQTENEYKISPRDKAELQRLAKRFVRRMQQTRDVGPLIKEFYLKEFTELMTKLGAADMKQSGGPRLTRKQFLSAYVAIMNSMYLTELSYMIGKGGDLSNILPANLAIALDDFPDETKTPTTNEYLAKLMKWQQNYQKAKAELKKRNYEASAKYKTTWA
jgi:hypothetical protein